MTTVRRTAAVTLAAFLSFAVLLSGPLAPSAEASLGAPTIPPSVVVKSTPSVVVGTAEACVSTVVAAGVCLAVAGGVGCLVAYNISGYNCASSAWHWLENKLGVGDPGVTGDSGSPLAGNSLVWSHTPSGAFKRTRTDCTVWVGCTAPDPMPFAFKVYAQHSREDRGVKVAADATCVRDVDGYTIRIVGQDITGDGWILNYASSGQQGGTVGSPCPADYYVQQLHLYVYASGPIGLCTGECGGELWWSGALPEGVPNGNAGGQNANYTAEVTCRYPNGTTATYTTTGTGEVTPTNCNATDQPEAPTATYTQEVAADSPFGFWRLDESSGTTWGDSSGNSRPMTFYGSQTPTYRATGPHGGFGVHYPTQGAGATYSYAGTTASQSNLSTWSGEVWFKLPNTVTDNVSLLSTCTNSGCATGDKGLFISPNGKLNFYVWNGAGHTLSTALPVSTGAWHHAVGTIGALGQRLYLDGDLVGSDSATTTSCGSACGSVQTYLHVATLTGGAYSGQGGPVQLADAATYPTQLATSRVTAHYNAPGTLLSPLETTQPVSQCVRLLYNGPAFPRELFSGCVPDQYLDCLSTLCEMDVYVDGEKCTIGAQYCVNWQTTSTTQHLVRCRWGPHLMPRADCVQEIPTKYVSDTGVGPNPTTSPYPPGTNGQPTTQPSPTTTTSAQPSSSATPSPSSSSGGLPSSGTNPDPGDGSSCLSAAWSWNPVDWVYVPVKCAVQWAFVPTDEATATVTSLTDDIQSRAPFTYIGDVDAWVGTMTAIPSGPACWDLDVDLGSYIGDVPVFDTCSGIGAMMEEHRTLMAIALYAGLVVPLLWWAWKAYSPGSTGVA